MAVRNLIQIPHFKFFFRLPAHIFFRDILPFVVELLAAGQADLHFHQAAFEINPQGHQRVSFFRDLPGDLIDLVPVHQKLLRPQRIFIENVSFFIRTDIAGDPPYPERDALSPA